ncbi:hypothetical protein [Caballeronia novacaledonica]|uniref:Uncharacterized protein n=1 Tax=Caballeronia novacaledonica TaxID=1544861 RepID=A0AA37IIK3_9BURK|nr:hypothetical protein [Caballeronia novacaledonica]GJH29313.1 hypothetical protein CBA19CS42_32375 [Caballeronia novacaledonica]
MNGEICAENEQEWRELQDPPPLNMTWSDLNIRVDGWWRQYQYIMACATADDTNSAAQDADQK